MHAIYNDIYIYEDYRVKPFKYGKVNISHNVLEDFWNTNKLQ